MKTFPRFMIAALVSVVCLSAPLISPPARAALPDTTVNIPHEMALINATTGKKEIYAVPDLALMSKAFIKLSGADLDNDTLVDEFASTNYCSIINQFYYDEFKWKEVRQRIRQQIEKDIPTYPETLLLHGTISIGRYDFDKKAFLLNSKSIMRNTGVFTLGLGGEHNKPCVLNKLTAIPPQYILRLANPISMDMIEMPEDKAADILKRIRVLSDPNAQEAVRELYVSFFIRINDFNLGKAKWKRDASQPAVVRATLVSMRIYEDQPRTRMIYEYSIDK